MIPPTTPAEFQQRIIYEDSELLLINKPAGWVVHGDRQHAHEPTLLSLALQYLEKTQLANFKPAFVHRLDKETSGVMVLTKTREALRALNRQLKFKKIQKKYLALLAEEIRPQGSIRIHLQKQMDRERWLALMVPAQRGGIYAHTEYKRLGFFEFSGEKFSLVEARPRTGRTHQLRAHFAAVSCPIVGDDLYGKAELNDRLRKELGVTRMLLHASAIEFAHPTTGELVRFTASLPEDFAGIVQRLKPRPSLDLSEGQARSICPGG